MSKKITIVVPCYNEEEVIEIFYQEIRKYFVEGYDFQILFVDDGSKDQTLSIVKNLAKRDSNVKYLSFSRNFGKEAAMLAGFKGALKLNTDAVIIIDVDLQDPPSLIPEMIKYYEQGYMHIYAKHRTRAGEAKLKTFFAKAFYKVYAFLANEKNLAQGARDFSLMDRRVVEAFVSIKDEKRFTKGISHWVGFKKKCLEFDYVPRAAGTTKWSFKKLFKYAMLGIKQFSHHYTWVTKIGITAAILFFIYDLAFSIYNQNIIIRNLGLDLLILMLFIVLHFVMKLMYDIRDQALNRPQYILQDGNINEENN